MEQTAKQYDQELSPWELYEYFKEHIRDTAKTQEEYEIRVQKLAEKLGI